MTNCKYIVVKNEYIDGENTRVSYGIAAIENCDGFISPPQFRIRVYRLGFSADHSCTSRRRMLSLPSWTRPEATVSPMGSKSL